MPVALGRLTETIFPRIYARMYYAHPRARVMSFSAREPARFPSSNPPLALRLQHMAHTLLQPHTHDSIGRAIIHTISVTFPRDSVWVMWSHVKKKEFRLLQKIIVSGRVGRMGRWGWGWQQILKYFIWVWKLFFFLATFSPSPSPIAPFAPPCMDRIFLCFYIFSYIEIIIVNNKTFLINKYHRTLAFISPHW